MITSLIALLSSSAIGSILGVIGGYFNRRLDMEMKKEEHKHELNKLDKDLEFMKAEYEQKTKVVMIEGEAAESVAGYQAMQASYNFANPTGSGLLDQLSRLVRPFITMAFFGLTVYIFMQLNAKISITVMAGEDLAKAYMSVIDWVLFQAGISIGWWFANRQSGPSIFGRK